MFEKFSGHTTEILLDSYGVSCQYKSEAINAEHLLLSLMLDGDNLAFDALSLMNVKIDAVSSELEHKVLTGKQKNIAPLEFQATELCLDELNFSEQALNMLQRACQMKSFFGHLRVEAEHILLAMLDLADEPVIRILEEVGANCNHLKDILLETISQRDAYHQKIINMQRRTPQVLLMTPIRTIIDGMTELIDDTVVVLDGLKKDSKKMNLSLNKIPSRVEVAHLFFIKFMPDFLFIQVAYQRYMLEENIKSLTKRTGNLDSGLIAQIVSNAAQYFRAEIRSSIEYIWSNEFRLLSKFPDEARYDLIGSVIEDLWWTHSEEIALTNIFDEAVSDHRKSQILNLQKRRLEIGQRFVKLRVRLEEAIKQCFLKNPLSC